MLARWWSVNKTQRRLNASSVPSYFWRSDCLIGWRNYEQGHRLHPEALTGFFQSLRADLNALTAGAEIAALNRSFGKAISFLLLLYKAGRDRGEKQCEKGVELHDV